MSAAAGVPTPESAWSWALESAYRTAQLLGLTLCFGTPLVLVVLLVSGAIPPGRQLPMAAAQQVGYLFTGLVFLAAAWSFWRSGRILAAFSTLDPGRRPGVLLRETLTYAALAELSSLLGLFYWLLAGQVVGRHAWGFLLLTPLLFLGVVPRRTRWKQTLEG